MKNFSLFLAALISRPTLNPQNGHFSDCNNRKNYLFKKNNYVLFGR